MGEPNLYEILGVDERAGPDEIKAAFLKLAKQFHPDKNINESEPIRRMFREKMVEINKAFAILSAAEKRA